MSATRLILTCGLPGAGKTTLAIKLAEERGPCASPRTSGSGTWALARGTAKLWSDLGDLLDEDEDEASPEAMTARLMDSGVRSPEAAKRLRIDGADAYRMLFDGELDGGPGRDGFVYFDEASIDR